MTPVIDAIRVIALNLALLKGNTAAPQLLQPNSFTCIARTAFAEARGEGADGMALVVRSMVNRHQTKGRSGCDMARRAYDGYTALKGRDPRKIDLDRWYEAQLISIQVIAGEYDLGDCKTVTHFLNPKAVKHMPKWANQDNQICELGNHVAYNVVNI